MLSNSNEVTNLPILVNNTFFPFAENAQTKKNSDSFLIEPRMLATSLFLSRKIFENLPFTCWPHARPPDKEDHPHTEWFSCEILWMPSLDKAFSLFLKTLRGDRSYAQLAKELGIAESTLYRLINGEQSATLRGVENVLQKLGLSPADVFGEAIHRKRSRRG
jgi:hypothetical protein